MPKIISTKKLKKKEDETRKWQNTDSLFNCQSWATDMGFHCTNLYFIFYIKFYTDREL